MNQNELSWTPETYRIFGIPLGTRMTYEAFLAAVHPEDRARVEADWKGALAGAPYDLEHRIVAGAAVRWVRERADIAFDLKGPLLGGIGTVQDITRRKEEEAALAAAHATEKRLRAELEDLTRASTAITEAVAELPQYDLATLLHVIALQAQVLLRADFVAVGLGTEPSRPFERWVQVGFDDATVAEIGRPPRPVSTLGAVAREGVVIRTADVRQHPRFAGFPAHHPEMGGLLGVPIRFRGAAVGSLFLARKPMAAQFTEQDERVVQMFAARAAVAIETATHYTGEALQRIWFQSMIDQMPEAVIFLDLKGKVALQNASARALAGRHNVELEGIALPNDLRFPDGTPVPPEERPIVRAVRRGESTYGAEYTLASSNGELIPVLKSAAPVRVGDQITGVVAVFQDIRAMKELERLREEWASVVAHDLRQPVNAIHLGTRVLAKLCNGENPTVARATLEQIRESTTRLDRMIGDLLDSSRLEARRMDIEPTVVDLSALVREMVDRFQQGTERNTWRVDAEPGLIAWIDRGRIQQVLENLLSNAVKYGNPGSEIVVSEHRRDNSAEVVVTNRGPGIPADQLSLLFSRFGRTREAKASGSPGLGLGLYIAQGLVEGHGGRMWVESTLGENTSFHFTVPLAQGDLNHSATL